MDFSDWGVAEGFWAERRMSFRERGWWQRWLLTVDEATTRTRSVLRSPISDQPSTLQLDSLEPRVLFSAAPLDLASLPAGDNAESVVEIDTDSAAGETIDPQNELHASPPRGLEPTRKTNRKLVSIPRYFFT